MPDPFHALDETVDRFGLAVGQAVALPVGQQLGLPPPDCPREPANFGDLDQVVRGAR